MPVQLNRPMPYDSDWRRCLSLAPSRVAFGTDDEHDPVIDLQPSRHPAPCRRTMLTSLDVLVFLEPWTLTVRCICGRERVASLPDLARVGLRDREHRTLGKLVRRLRCQDCGQPPASVIAE